MYAVFVLYKLKPGLNEPTLNNKTHRLLIGQKIVWNLINLRLFKQTVTKSKYYNLFESAGL